ncbi:MAG: bifunctional alpha/beta hydrolase/OsmC family protein [Burkholderiales bacterium]|jgi:putative redox protein
MTKSTRNIEFPGSQGLKLAARLDLPLGKPTAYAIFAHCFTCTKDSKAASYIGSALVAAGVAVLRFDFTGLGGSEGDFSNTGFSSNVEDLVSAADFLRSEYEAPKLLVGHSLGGTAVLAAAPQIPEVVAVATINAPADPAHVLEKFGSSLEKIESTGKAEVMLGGRPFTIRKSFVDDAREQHMQKLLPELHRALLVMHSPHDRIVDVSNAQKIFVPAKHPKSFISLDDADHLLSRSDDARYAGMVLAAWAARYLPSRVDQETAHSGKGDVLVMESGDGKYAQTINVGRHWLRADEPPSVGGDDSGPSPYQLLSASLGACTTMTMRMYANHKNWPVGRMSVRVHHEKIHAKDCAECEKKEGKVDRMEREIEIEGDLSNEQRQRLLEIADKCPVHRTLHAQVVVKTRLV